MQHKQRKMCEEIKPSFVVFCCLFFFLNFRIMELDMMLTWIGTKIKCCFNFSYLFALS